MCFLAQIDLKEISAVDKEHRLPDDGILSFFYDLETMTWGLDPDDKGSAKVFVAVQDEKVTGVYE